MTTKTKKELFKKLGKTKAKDATIYQCTNEECLHVFNVFFQEQLDYKIEFGCPECNRRKALGIY